MVCLECQSDVCCFGRIEEIVNPIKQASRHSVVLLSNRNRKTVFDNRSRHFLLVITDLLLRSDHFVIDRGDVHKVDSMSALGQQDREEMMLASSADTTSYLP